MKKGTRKRVGAGLTRTPGRVRAADPGAGAADQGGLPPPAGGRPLCFNCEKPTTDEHLCFGCNSYVCGECDRNAVNMPFGAHDRALHLGEPRDDTYDL